MSAPSSPLSPTARLPIRPHRWKFLPLFVEVLDWTAPGTGFDSMN